MATLPGGAGDQAVAVARAAEKGQDGTDGFVAPLSLPGPAPVAYRVGRVDLLDEVTGRTKCAHVLVTLKAPP